MGKKIQAAFDSVDMADLAAKKLKEQDVSILSRRVYFGKKARLAFEEFGELPDYSPGVYNYDIFNPQSREAANVRAYPYGVGEMQHLNNPDVYSGEAYLEVTVDESDAETAAKTLRGLHGREIKVRDTK